MIRDLIILPIVFLLLCTIFWKFIRNIYQEDDEICYHFSNEDFHLWAFGEKFPDLNRVPYLWNKKHGDKLQICDSGHIPTDLRTMYKLWLESLNES